MRQNNQNNQNNQNRKTKSIRTTKQSKKTIISQIPTEIIMQALIQNDGLIKPTAELLNVNPIKLRLFLNKNIVDMSGINETIQENNLDLAEEALFSLIKNKNFPAIKYFLNNKGKSRGYKPKDQIQNNIKNGIVLVPTTKSNEEWIKTTKELVEATEDTKGIEDTEDAKSN